MAAALAVAVANGTPFLSRPVNATGSVAIITGDPGDDDYYASMLYGRVETGSVRSYAFSRPPMPETWAKVCYEIERNATRLVVIDNLVSFVPGDVNDHRPVRMFHDTAIDPLTRAGISVVLIHHTSEKRGEHGTPKIPMGNTAISAAARWKWRVELPDIAGPATLTFEGNYGPVHEMIVTRPEGKPIFDVIDVIKPDELVKRTIDRRADTQAKRAEIRQFILGECISLNGKETAEAIAEKFGGSVRTHAAQISRHAYGVRRDNGRWVRTVDAD